jgi:hypothetical protein
MKIDLLAVPQFDAQRQRHLLRMPVLQAAEFP